MEAVIEQEFEAQSYDPASILRGKSVASRLMRVVTGACATRCCPRWTATSLRDVHGAMLF